MQIKLSNGAIIEDVPEKIVLEYLKGLRGMAREISENTRVRKYRYTVVSPGMVTCDICESSEKMDIRSVGYHYKKTHNDFYVRVHKKGKRKPLTYIPMPGGPTLAPK